MGDVQLPSLSEVLRITGVAADLSQIPIHLLERKRRIGTAVHKAIALHLRGDLDWSSLKEDIIGYVRAAAEYLDTKGFTTVAVERPYGGIRLGYGCTPDYVHTKGLVEWKTTSKLYPEVPVQLIGQSRAVGLADDSERVAVRLASDGTFEEHICNDPSDIWVFNGIQEILKWRMKKKILIGI